MAFQEYLPFSSQQLLKDLADCDQICSSSKKNSDTLWILFVFQSILALD